MTGQYFYEWQSDRSTCPQQQAATSALSRAGWKEYLSPSGVPYFHNAQRGESSWEKPSDLWSRQVTYPEDLMPFTPERKERLARGIVLGVASSI